MKRTNHRRKPKAYRHARPTQLGLVNQTGQGNTQTVHLKLVQQLRLCRAGHGSLVRELALSQALVAAQSETIALLRGGYTRIN